MLAVGLWLVGAGGLWADGRSITVTGTIDDPEAQVTVNGASATVSEGSFSATVTLVEGSNTITATASDPAGNTSSSMVQVSLDTVPPVIVITDPTDGQIFGAQ
jgi:hypothetical protein